MLNKLYAYKKKHVSHVGSLPIRRSSLLVLLQFHNQLIKNTYYFAL